MTTTAQATHATGLADHARALGAANDGWPIERAVSLLSGSFIVGSLVLGRAHSPRWRIMTGLIGSNLVLQAAVGWCPASVVMRMLGMRSSREQNGGGARAAAAHA